MIKNSDIHTRESDDLKLSMTMSPDYLCMTEVKGSEAFEAIEAAINDSHPVICRDDSYRTS